MGSKTAPVVVMSLFALMDGEDLVIKARFGYYTNPTVEVRFRDFLQ